MKSKILKYLIWSFVFLFLTLLTQIGGVVFILALFVSKKIKPSFYGKTWGVFLALYFIFTLLIVPFIAPVLGREKVLNTSKIKPTNYITILLNRNYVRPEMNKVLLAIEKDLNNKNSTLEIRYLDANFPFINKFPLPPHLSHNDGKKLDISLVYETPNGEITNAKKSVSGYGVFVEPTSTEFNQNKYCKDAGYFQYDFSKYLTLGSINDELTFSINGTKQLMNSIVNQPEIGKIFIEEHLKNRMGLTHPKIRFHGCGAVRHDDHIHIQLK